MAQHRWVKLQSNRALGAYDVYEGSSDLPPPQWPDLTFQEILDIAFADFRIESLDHPAILALHGKQ